MIQCSGITKSFTDKKVLSGISFDIPDGQIFGLLGPSGAGKTTLIKILTGQLAFDEGSAMILQKNVRRLTGEDKKKIGIMMDQFGVYERLSCYDNLKVFADIYGTPKEKIMETLRLVGLEDSAKKPASSLSKGMRVRLQLARVFMVSPEIIFLDEPTTGLDPMTMKQIHRIILDKKKHGCTIFLTTHNMEEAAKLCDTVALLNEGEDRELSHSRESAAEISKLLEEEKVETIHSSEPTLETVFLELTGRKLEEE